MTHIVRIAAALIFRNNYWLYWESNDLTETVDEE